MATKITEKTLIRLDVQRAVRQLRDRLDISQARLAEMLGKLVESQVSMITVSRWERGALLPYPKNRQGLAQIAMANGCWDIAAALGVDVPLAEWLSVLETNSPTTYRAWMVLSMCALNCDTFEPDGSNEFGKEEEAIHQKIRAIVKSGEQILARMATLHFDGKELITRPPNAQYQRFWWGILERTTGHGKTKKSKS
jgi:transcriptional regulator with XRE-family HTH domain